MSKKHVTKVARECGFEKHKRGKIKAHSLILAFMSMLQEGVNTYSAWARALASQSGQTVSKQAIFDRMNTSWVNTVKTLVKEVMQQKLHTAVSEQLLNGFGTVWIQDSTSVHLWDILNDLFPGNYSKGVYKAVAKLNLILDLGTGLARQMKWVSFRQSETSMSDDMLQIAIGGDLVLRDRGYFDIKAFRKMQEAGIYFISRLIYGTNVYHAKSGKQFNLLRYLRGKAQVDIPVLFGAEQKLELRLVAIKLSDAQKQARIRKAKKDRDKRVNHSKEYYALLGYLIFITNVPENRLTTEQVSDAYRLRWHIEIIFKSWKSGFKMLNLIPEARTQTARVESVLYLILLYVLWYTRLIGISVYEQASRCGKYISIIKLVQWAKTNIFRWLTEPISKKMITEIIYYSCYDKRRNRTNEQQLLELLSSQFT